jgi:hypothetical protein
MFHLYKYFREFEKIMLIALNLGKNLKLGEKDVNGPSNFLPAQNNNYTKIAMDITLLKKKKSSKINNLYFFDK